MSIVVVIAAAVCWAFGLWLFQTWREVPDEPLPHRVVVTGLGSGVHHHLAPGTEIPAVAFDGEDYVDVHDVFAPANGDVWLAFRNDGAARVCIRGVALGIVSDSSGVMRSVLHSFLDLHLAPQGYGRVSIVLERPTQLERIELDVTREPLPDPRAEKRARLAWRLTRFGWRLVGIVRRKRFDVYVTLLRFAGLLREPAPAPAPPDKRDGSVQDDTDNEADEREDEVPARKGGRS